MLFPKYTPAIILLAVIAIAVYLSGPTTPAEYLAVLTGLAAISAFLIKLIFIFVDANHNLAVQAKKHRKSLASMWLDAFKKTTLYLFLPAAVITAILVLVALALRS